MTNPTLQSHTHFQAAQTSRTIQSLSKSVSFPTHGRMKIKHESTTMAIRNEGLSADIKSIASSKLYDRLTGKCLETATSHM